jgi:MFS transporter, SP family, arabinose:H+ symporter
MRRQIFLWSITSALAGFLFGFDTVVISGAEQTIQELWGLSSAMHGFVMGTALYGTVLGSLVGGWPTRTLGRKKTLLFIGVLYVVSAIGCALAEGVGLFSAARFLGGLGIGISTVVSPLYISEIAPPRYRGRLAGLFQLNIVIGIVVAFLSNALIASYGGEGAWRWMLGIAAIPSVIYAVMCLGLPESPRWLISTKNDRAAGLAVLKLIEPEKTDAQLAAQADAIQSAAGASTTSGFWSARSRTPILLAFFIAFFNQLSGINAILYFAPRIFEMTGLGEQAAMLQSVGIGVTNLLFTFVGLWLIDRLGRRTLLYIGSFGYILSLGLTAWAFFTGHFAIVPVCIFAFIAAHAIGQGTVIWVFIAEIFPNRHRAEGQALGSFTHWVFAAILTTIFPKMVELSGANEQPARAGYVFGFFMLMMVFQLIWVRTMVPETKGIPLEEMQQKLGVELGGDGRA